MKRTHGDTSIGSFPHHGTGTEVNAPAEMPEFSDRAVQFGKTGDAYGAGTIVLEGSNDGVTWFTLKSPLGTVLSFTANAMHQVLENPRFVRPNLSGGAAGGVDVFMLCHRGRAWSGRG